SQRARDRHRRHPPCWPPRFRLRSHRSSARPRTVVTDSPAEPRIRVLIADDQPLLRHSLAVLISSTEGLAVVGEAEDGGEAVRLARELTPDIILMDIRMPDTDGIEATGIVTADPALRHCRVLVLSMFELDEYVYGALRAGASGFLLKD